MTTVRTGTGLDEDDAVAVWQAAEAGGGRRSGGTRAQRVRMRLRSPAALLLVADQRDVDQDEGSSGGRTARPVGVLLAELDRVHGLVVELLAVAPPAQRTGVGRALLGALLARYPSAVVRVAPDDVPALALLGAAGLERVEGLERVDAEDPDGRTWWRLPAQGLPQPSLLDASGPRPSAAEGNAAPPAVVGSRCDDGQP